MIERDLASKEKLEILDRLSASETFVGTYGKPISVDRQGIMHDPQTISQGCIYFCRVHAEKSPAQVAIKKYSQFGYPTNEFASYRLLETEKNRIKRPVIYYSGDLKPGESVLIAEKLTGYQLNKFLLMKNSKTARLQLLKDVIQELSKLKPLLSPTDVLMSIAPNTWIKEEQINLEEFVIKGHKRALRMLENNNILDQEEIDRHLAWVRKHLDIIRGERLNMCQGDATADNIILSKNREILGILDWEYAYYGPLSKDIADVVYSFWISVNKRGSLEDLLNITMSKGFKKRRVVFYMIMRTLIQAGVASKNTDYVKCSDLIDLTNYLKSSIRP